MSYRLLSAVLCIFLCSLAQGLKADRDQPVHIEANTVHYYRKAGLCIYTGQVQIDQGSSHLSGDEVTSYFDSQQRLIRLVAKGLPAHFTTVLDHKLSLLNTSAETITYHIDKGYLEFDGHAYIVQDNDTLKGPLLIYKLAEQSIISPDNTQKGPVSFTIQVKKRV